MPATIRSCCVGLREFNASNNALTDVGNMFAVPANHGWQSSLIMLDVSNNKIGSLHISGLEALDSVNFASNRLTMLQLVGPFPKLSTLIGESNQLVEFPCGLLPDSAPSLCTVDLANNSINTLPPELGRSQTLKRVALDGNPLRSIRPDLLRGGAEKLKAHLRSRLVGGEDVAGMAAAAEDELAVELRSAAAAHELHLDDRQLASLPPLPAGLHILHVPGNSLVSDALFGAFGKGGPADWQSLRELNASRNKLGEGLRADELVSRLLRGLPSLQDLYLSSNRICSLGTPQAWSWTSRSTNALPLRIIDLSCNGLSTIPWELLQASPNLSELRLRQNRVDSTSLDCLIRVAGVKLSTLDLEENRLTSVPAWFPSALPRLHTLMLANNDIGPTIPPEWGFWESLQVVSLAGNPLRGLKQALSSKGWPSLAGVLRDRLPEGSSTVAALPQMAPVLNVAPSPRDTCDQLPRGHSFPNAASPREVERMPKDVDASRARCAAAQSPPSTASARQAAAPGTAPHRAASGAPLSIGALEARAEKLRAEVVALEGQLGEPGLSRAKQSSLTHGLRMKRGDAMKAEKELKRALAVAAPPFEDG